MKEYIKSFEIFESLGFDRFMRQAQVAQSGNPYWFGRNPKPKKTEPKLSANSKLIKNKNLN
jgi:hypothetical protein